jgi:hypothetical protein
MLYLLLPLMIGLFWWETRAPLSRAAHTVLEAGIVVFTFGLVWLWLEASQRALIQEERQKRRRELRRALEPLHPPESAPELPAARRDGALPAAQRLALPNRLTSWMAHFFHL